MNLEVLRRTAAEIAAAAVYETYPEVELLSCGPSSTGFVCEFFFPHPIHPHIIEENIKQIVREKRPIRLLEMVPFSASELLLSLGQTTRAEALPDEHLVQVVQIGAFHNYSPGEHLKNTAELAAFKIKAEPLPDKGMRLTGWCHSSKDELKQFLKQLENYTEPSQIGESLGFWRGDVWYGPGLRLKEKLIQFLKHEWFQGALEIACPEPFSLHRQQKRPKVAEVSKDEIRVSFFNLSDEEKISFLQLVGKTLIILGFDHSISTGGFTTVDGIGRIHTLVTVDRSGSDLQITAHLGAILEQLVDRNLIGMLENK